MKKEQKFSRSPAKLIILYLFITIFILIIGVRYYYIQKDEIKNEAYTGLSVIAELKAKQIVNWRNERIGDANVIYNNKIYTDEIKKWFDSPDDIVLRENIVSQFYSYYNFYRYKDIIIFDTNVVVKLSFNEKIRKLGLSTYNKLKIASLNKKIYFSEIYSCDLCNEIHLDIVIPLYNKNILFGGIILRIDPEEFLFPLIQTWPTTSSSSETLIIKKEEDEVVFLNELRHRKNTALKLKFKIDSTNINIPAIQAVLGKEGLVEGLDYRDVPVLSDIRKIPDSHWYMISKVDLDEIYLPIREKAISVSVLMGLLLISFAIGFIWVWTNQKKSLRIQHLEEESRRQAIVKHFEYLVKYANDIIILSNEKLQIKEVNQRALDVYGFTKEEMINMKIPDLLAPESHPVVENAIDINELEKGVIFENTHKRKDNSTFPVETSFRTININGEKYSQRIIRDISERKKAEELIRESELLYRNLFTHMVEGFAYCRMIYDGEYPKDFRYLKVNTTFELLTGLKDVEGKLVTDVIPGIRTMDDKLFEIYSRVALSGKAERFEIYVEALKDWYYISVYCPKKEYFVAVFDVITKRKAIEEALKESEVKFRTIFENAILGIYRTTPDGQIIDCNPALLKMLGFDSLDELEKRNLEMTGFEPGYSREEFKKKIEIEGEILGLESAWIKKDGTSIYISENAKAIKDKNGKFLFYEGTVEDITERKKMEEDLRISENKYRRLHESMMDGFVLVDMNGCIIDCNDSFESMLGYSFEELQRLKFPDITPEKWHNLEEKIIKDKIILLGYSDVYEKEYIKKDGTVFPIEIRTFLLKNDEGENEGMWAIVREITERKRFESEQFKLLNILEKSLNEIYVFDSENLRFEYVNYGALKNIGYTMEEMMEMTPLDIKPELNPNSFMDMLELLKNDEKERVIFESKHRRKNGTVYDVEVHLQMYRKEDKNFYYAIISDITDRKKMETMMYESENKFRSLFESMNEGVALHELIFDNEGKAVDYKIVDVNPAYEKHTGYSIDKAKNRVATELYGTKTFPPYFDIYSKVARTGTPYFFESYFSPLNKYFEVSVFSPKKNWFATVFADVTERKRVDIALRESERKLREAQEMAHLGYWFWDVKTGNVEWSDEVYKIFHLTPKEFTPQIDSILALSPWTEENQRDKELIKKAIESHEPGSYEQKFLRPDNSIGYYSSTFQGKYDDSGELVSIVGSVMDITERKKAEEEIKKLNEELEQRVIERTSQLERANKELEAFSYSVSHDLRAPLRSIDGFSLAIYEDFYKNLDVKGKEYIERIRNATKRMDELIDSMLKLSRVTRYEIHNEEVDLSSLAYEIAENLKNTDDKRNTEFIIHKDIKLKGDIYLLRILLDNLLGNALKFTAKEEKAIIELGTFKKDSNTIYFIRDNGIGFDMNYYDKLFGAFQRLHSKKDFPGTGIGLATVQRIVHRHNGKIWAESKINKGTTFYFTLN